jgi:cysteinyl-tRNA synthetase
MILAKERSESMRLFNTMTQRVEDFTAPEGHVRLYVCGVTPYDTAHLGHAFVFATFDTLVRFLRAQGLAVTYTQNVTDIDDPLFAKADELGIHWNKLAQRETARFLREMAAIDVAMPDHYVRASEELQTMFGIIQTLLDKNNAYISDGWIYFSSQSDPTYGALAKAAGFDTYAKLLAEANEHGNDPNDPRKRDPLDFLLWRAKTQPDEPAWDSPWGPGRPGWHIECTAMATRYLGPTLDIHGGGTDLIFPHHSSEIAQAENATGVRPYVRYWMHVGLVALDGEKMSKSKGNLTIVGQLLNDYDPSAVRLLLASHHYRQPWEYFDADMPQAQARAARLAEAMRLGDDLADTPAYALWSISPRFAPAEAFIAALEDDLDTPRALAQMERVADDILAGNYAGAERATAHASLRAMAHLLGLRLTRA